MKRKPSPEQFLAAIDPVLRKVIRKVGPLEHSVSRGGVHTVAEIIVKQQLSGKAAATIFKRICQAAGVRRLSAASLDRLTDEQLRTAGVSGAKTKYLRELTRQVQTRQVRLHALGRMADDAVIAELTRIKGIGRWSAEMYLMFVLGRPDVFSAGDNGLQTAIQKLYGVSTDDGDLEEFSARWRPHRTLACLYLWRSLSNEQAD